MKYDIALTECGLPYLRKLKNSKADEKLPGGKYDVILFSHVLQKIKNEELVFEELKRLLRPGGFALIQTLIDWKMERTYENPKNEEDIDRLKPIFEPGIERIYGANFKKQLVNTGFHVEMIDYADLLGNYAQTYYQLGNGSREIIFKCKKYKIT
jgi:SAM-dependent methyltransferase